LVRSIVIEIVYTPRVLKAVKVAGRTDVLQESISYLVTSLTAALVALSKKSSVKLDATFGGDRMVLILKIMMG
jgi:hypothetical protein